jgi:hypothetical protein
MDTIVQEERNDLQKVGKNKFTSKLHPKFLDGNITSQCCQILVLIKFDKRGRD